MYNGLVSPLLIKISVHLKIPITERPEQVIILILIIKENIILSLLFNEE